MVSCLEEFYADETNSLVARSFAAAILFCTWACMRLKQSQMVCIKGIRITASGNPLDSIIEGFVLLDKGRGRSAMRPRPFWMPLHGITGSRKWFDILWHTIEDVSDKCYVFRAFFPAGSIWDAKKFLKQPAQYDHLLKAFRQVLARACNLSPEQALGYSCHSPRHFLPEVARGRGEAETCRVELGRWKGSVAQLDRLMPAIAAVRKHEIICAQMADLYAQQSAIARPIAILKRQMDALRALYMERGSSSSMPPLEGWADLAPFTSTGHEYDKKVARVISYAGYDWRKKSTHSLTWCRMTVKSRSDLVKDPSMIC